MRINLSTEHDKVQRLSHSQLCLYLLRHNDEREFQHGGNLPRGGMLEVCSRFFIHYIYILLRLCIPHDKISENSYFHKVCEE